ncbi:hypothetical protein XELAEV_18002687mg [Xenopus laevis]|nr:hypothetical protein XELAEV_18002687mg [Xenopus laevis]
MNGELVKQANGQQHNEVLRVHACERTHAEKGHGIWQVEAEGTGSAWRGEGERTSPGRGNRTAPAKGGDSGGGDKPEGEGKVEGGDKLEMEGTVDGMTNLEGEGTVERGTKPEGERGEEQSWTRGGRFLNTGLGIVQI